MNKLQATRPRHFDCGLCHDTKAANVTYDEPVAVIGLVSVYEEIEFGTRGTDWADSSLEKEIRLA